MKPTPKPFCKYKYMQNDMLHYSKPPQTGPIHFHLKDPHYNLKGTLHFFLKIGSFSNSPRVKQLSFTIFESIHVDLRVWR